MFFNRCPAPEELHRYARQPDSARISRHLKSCEKCQKDLVRIREDERLLNELRALDAEEIDESIRNRLLDLCLGLTEREKTD